MNYAKLLSPHHVAALHDWLAETGELYVHIGSKYDRAVANAYFITELGQLKNLLSDPSRAVFEVYIFRDRQFPVRGIASQGMVNNAMGKAGKLDVNIDAVRLITGEKAALRAVKEVVGGNHTGAMTGAIVVTAIVFFPAAPFFLFMHGKDITIPQGTEITAYINGDTELDRGRFEAALQEGTATPKPADSSGICIVMVKSIPDGGEITVDGKFVGNAPSTLRLTPGDHVISVTKTGFKTREKTVTLTAGGNITLEANLENN